MKSIKYILSVFALSILFLFNGCIENLNSLPLNIPVKSKITISGSDNNTSASDDFCMNESSVYQDYQDKINDIELLQVSLRVESVTPSNIQGDVTVTIMDQGGNVLFTYPVGTINPADYISQALILQLSQAQLQAISNYLSNFGTCFIGQVQVNNITPTGDKTIVFVVELLFQADTEL